MAKTKLTATLPDGTTATRPEFRQAGRDWNGAPMIRVEKLSEEWALHTDAELTDEEAAAITFQALPTDLVLGDFVAVHDAKGCRIGHAASARYYSPTFAPHYVVVGIHLL